MSTNFKVGDKVRFLRNSRVIPPVRGITGKIVAENSYVWAVYTPSVENNNFTHVNKTNDNAVMRHVKPKNKTNKFIFDFNETLNLVPGDVVRISPNSYGKGNKLATVVNVHDSRVVMVFFHDMDVRHLHYYHEHQPVGYGYTFLHSELNKVPGAKHPFAVGDSVQIIVDNLVDSKFWNKKAIIKEIFSSPKNDNGDECLIEFEDNNLRSFSILPHGYFTAKFSRLIPCESITIEKSKDKTVNYSPFKVGDRVKSLVNIDSGNSSQPKIDKGDTGTIIRVPGFSSPASSMYYRVVFDKFNWEENKLYTIYAAPMLGYEIEKIV